MIKGRETQLTSNTSDAYKNIWKKFTQIVNRDIRAPIEIIDICADIIRRNPNIGEPCYNSHAYYLLLDYLRKLDMISPLLKTYQADFEKIQIDKITQSLSPAAKIIWKQNFELISTRSSRFGLPFTLEMINILKHITVAITPNVLKSVLYSENNIKIDDANSFLKLPILGFCGLCQSFSLVFELYKDLNYYHETLMDYLIDTSELIPDDLIAEFPQQTTDGEKMVQKQSMIPAKFIIILYYRRDVSLFNAFEGLNSDLFYAIVEHDPKIESLTDIFKNHKDNLELKKKDKSTEKEAEMALKQFNTIKTFINEKRVKLEGDIDAFINAQECENEEERNQRFLEFITPESLILIHHSLALQICNQLVENVPFLKKYRIFALKVIDYHRSAGDTLHTRKMVRASLGYLFMCVCPFFKTFTSVSIDLNRCFNISTYGSSLSSVIKSSLNILDTLPPQIDYFLFDSTIGVQDSAILPLSQEEIRQLRQEHRNNKTNLGQSKYEKFSRVLSERQEAIASLLLVHKRRDTMIYFDVDNYGSVTFDRKTLKLDLTIKQYNKEYMMNRYNFVEFAQGKISLLEPSQATSAYVKATSDAFSIKVNKEVLKESKKILTSLNDDREYSDDAGEEFEEIPEFIPVDESYKAKPGEKIITSNNSNRYIETSIYKDNDDPFYLFATYVDAKPANEEAAELTDKELQQKYIEDEDEKPRRDPMKPKKIEIEKQEYDDVNEYEDEKPASPPVRRTPSTTSNSSSTSSNRFNNIPIKIDEQAKPSKLASTPSKFTNSSLTTGKVSNGIANRIKALNSAPPSTPDKPPSTTSKFTNSSSTTSNSSSTSSNRFNNIPIKIDEQAKSSKPPSTTDKPPQKPSKRRGAL